MPRYEIKRSLPYTSENLYRLVEDVKSYPLFVPGCKGITVYDQCDTSIDARMDVSWGPVEGTFRSSVVLTPFDRIVVHYTEGPFEHLKSLWTFKPNIEKKGYTHLDFLIDFSFGNFLKDHMASYFFKNIVADIIKSFEKRAKELYCESNDSSF